MMNVENRSHKTINCSLQVCSNRFPPWIPLSHHNFATSIADRTMCLKPSFLIKWTVVCRFLFCLLFTHTHTHTGTRTHHLMLSWSTDHRTFSLIMSSPIPKRIPHEAAFSLWLLFFSYCLFFSLSVSAVGSGLLSASVPLSLRLSGAVVCSTSRN